MELIPPGSRPCLVVGCDEPAVALWGIHHVCTFHFTALTSGEPFDYGDMNEWPGPILMGEDMPGELVSVRSEKHADAPQVVVLGIGRDGIEDRQVRLRMTLSQARSIVFLLEHSEDQS